MTDAATVLAQYGIKRPAVTIAAAQQAGLELAVAAAMLMAESSGGTMEFGHDGSPSARRTDAHGTVIYQFGGPVTQANYTAYRVAQRAGIIPRQGIGDAQLTSEEFVARAEQIGPGPWDPYCNQLSGFIGLQNRIAQHGLLGGLENYNGSGPAAVRYADQLMAQVTVWRARLAGATTEGDDLTPEQAQQLEDIHDRLARVESAWGGGYTDSQNTPYDGFEYGKRTNVEVHQCWLAVQALTTKVDALTALVQQGAKP